MEINVKINYTWYKQSHRLKQHRSKYIEYFDSWVDKRGHTEESILGKIPRG